MKKIIPILLMLSYFSTDAKSIIDSIVKEKIEANWSEQDNYFKSESQANTNSFIRDYGNFILLKYRYEGLLIDKQTGNTFQKISQNRISENGTETGMWDLSPADSSKLLIVEYGKESKDKNFIISYKDMVTDTLFSWVLDKEQFFPPNTSENNFYAITDSTFFVQSDYVQFSGPYRTPFTTKLMINSTRNSKLEFNDLNLNRLVRYGKDVFFFSNSNTIYSRLYNTDYEDSHTIYILNSDTLLKQSELEVWKSNWFKEPINDSIYLTIYKDTLVLYNYINNTAYSKHPTGGNENPIGAYWNEDRKTVNVAFATKGDSTKIMTIHYPSKNIIKRERVLAPYLGRFVMNTTDGYTLSVGQNGLLYKHGLKLFASDSLNADFSFKNTADYELQFSDDSFGAITAWLWDFGDGDKSTERRPTHKYSSAGTNEVQLIVTDEYGKKDTTIKQIKVTQKLKAQFDFGRFTGQAPFTVQFKNYSSDNAVRYIWNFGDGTYSYEIEPAHTYITPDEYSVSLTVFDENESFHTTVQDKKIIITQ